MKKHTLTVLIMTVIASLLLSSCNILHRHTFGDWQYNGSGHFKECSCGYTISQSTSKHMDEDKDDACDICHYPMKYEINSLSDLSWYLLYYYESNQYAYSEETNMKIHSIHEMNFKNTLTYNENQTRVKFQTPYFNEYLTALPKHAEYIKSNAEYYSHYTESGYIQVNTTENHYLFETQETVRYGLSDQHCDYQRFTNTTSKFKTVNDFYDTTSSSTLTKGIYADPESYDEHNMSFKNEVINSVIGEISHFIRYYLNVEFTDHGEIILPETSYFDNVDIRTENGIVCFSIEKSDGKTFWGDDERYTIIGSINLKTHNLSYNVKKSYYFDGEILSYVDYDYDLSLTNEPIDIEFDFNGEFKEVYIETN